MTGLMLPMPIAPRFCLTSNEGTSPALSCPLCHSPHVHPVRVTVDQNDRRTQIDGRATSVVPVLEHERRRGSVIDLQMTCERRHAFVYRLEFAQGQLRVGLLADLLEADDNERLWRN